MLQSISRRGFVALLALVAYGCGTGQIRRDSEREVETFHRQLDAGNFAAMYAAADPDLKKATTEKDFVARLDAVHRKLGTVRASRRDGSSVDSTGAGTTVKLNFQTAFSEGDGAETFEYRVSGGKTLLLSYDISSLALDTK